MAEIKPISDLIYTRLDLPQSPRIDPLALRDWAYANHRSVMGQKKLHDDNASGGSYPWRAVHACSYDVWDAEFAKAFPDVVAYVNHFPVGSWHRICIICQEPDKEVFLHTDPDYGIGWRVYLSNGGPRLYFRKFKERHEKRPETWSSGGPIAIESLCESERIYVDDAQEPYPWALTSTRAAHGVDAAPLALGERVTMLLMPQPETIDHAVNERLLRRSAEKFSDTAIWY